MTFFVYLIVALIAAGSVLFGLGWGPAPMSPMPPAKYEIRAAVPPPPPAPVVVETRPEPKPAVAANVRPEVKPAAPAATAPTAAAPKVSAPAAVPPSTPAPAVTAQAPAPAATDQAPASIVAEEPRPAAADTAAAAPKCNIEACTNAYRSFTADDCTYQPNDGPRRLCTKGAPPAAAAAPSATVPEARAQACNIAACSQSYPRSFNAADCTFQPAEGPRRACTK